MKTPLASLICLTFAAFASSIAAQAQVLDGYAFYDPPKPPAPTSTYVIEPNTPGLDNVPATVGNPGTLASALALGPGFAPDYNFRLGFSPNAGTDYATTVAGAKTAGDYLTFSISPTAPNTGLDISAIDFLNGPNSTGGGNGSGVDFITPDSATETFTLESSADNFSSVLGSFSGSEFVGNISGSDLSLNLGPLTGTTVFRLYITTPGDATESGETGLYRGTLDVDGAVVMTPEPGTCALFGLGLALSVLAVWKRRPVRA